MSILTLHKIEKVILEFWKQQQNKQNYNSINVNQAAKPEIRIFKDRFKSCFDTGRL